MAHDKTLKYLNISHNNIGPAGARELASGLAKNKTLRVLVLDGNPIEFPGGLAIRRLQRHRDEDWPKLDISLEDCLFDTSLRMSFDPQHPNGMYALDLRNSVEEKIALHLLFMASSLDDCDVYLPLTHVRTNESTEERNRATAG